MACIAASSVPSEARYPSRGHERALSRYTLVRAWRVIDFAPDLHVATFCSHESRMIHGGLEFGVRHLTHGAMWIQRDDEERCNALGSAFFADDEIAGQRVIGRHGLNPVGEPLGLLSASRSSWDRPWNGQRNLVSKGCQVARRATHSTSGWLARASLRLAEDEMMGCRMVSRAFTSWNQMVSFLRGIDRLRVAA
jgi:hypothetical protein